MINKQEVMWEYSNDKGFCVRRIIPALGDGIEVEIPLKNKPEWENWRKRQINHTFGICLRNSFAHTGGTSEPKYSFDLSSLQESIPIAAKDANFWLATAVTDYILGGSNNIQYAAAELGEETRQLIANGQFRLAYK